MTLVWEPEDVIGCSPHISRRSATKFMDMPASHYATYPYDQVLINGRQVGISFYPVYTA
jgi:hypothetical protein